MAATISVIVLTWNGEAYIRPCLEALFRQDYPSFEVIVVDNASVDNSVAIVQSFGARVRLIRNERNLGFAGGCNVGLRAATGDILLLLNQDTVVQPGCLTAFAAALCDMTTGLVGGKLLYPDGTLQHAGALLFGARGESAHIGRREPDQGQYDQPREMDFVTGAAIALRRPALAQIGFLDEGFAPAYYEDVDWCYRARLAGLRVIYWPFAVVVHHESTSCALETTDHQAVIHHSRLRLLYKHKPLDWLEHEFLPAELEWVGLLRGSTELLAAREAYLRLMLSLPEMVAFRVQMGISRQASFQEVESLLASTSKLRAACVESSLPPKGTDGQRARDGHLSKVTVSTPGGGQPPSTSLPADPSSPVPGGWRHKVVSLYRAVALVPYLQQMIDRLENLDDRLESLNVRLGGLDNSLDGLDNRLDGLDNRLDGQTLGIAQSIREINALAQALTSLQMRSEGGVPEQERTE